MEPTPMSDTPEVDHSIDEILRRWPGAARALIRRGMACVGCVMAPFETIRDVARNYGIDEAALLRQMRSAARKQRSRD